MTIPFDRHRKKKIQNITLLIFFFGAIILLLGSFINNLFFTSIGLLITIYISISYLIDLLKYRHHPPLTLNEKGIIDNIDIPYFGLIEWNDIINFRIDKKIKNIILIDVKNETKYLNQLNVNARYGKYYKDKLKNDSYGYGTVVFINVKNLSGGTDIILKKIIDYKAKNNI